MTPWCGYLVGEFICQKIFNGTEQEELMPKAKISLRIVRLGKTELDLKRV